MLDFYAGTYDLAVIGAGHAGIEAALAGARLGARTLCICTSLDGVGNMPCNPSVGGTAKGQLVREIDALGGEMGRAADETGLQFRMLNRGKGPAVYSPRAQADRMAYRAYMRRVLDGCKGLDLVQGECAEVLRDGENAVSGVRLVGGARYDCRAVVLATGTFLSAKTFTGEVVRHMGPDGMYAADALSPSLLALGLTLRRFKTGTPARVSGKSLDFSKMEPQTGDAGELGFSFDRTAPARQESTCWLTYTNEKTHEIIRKNIKRSPLYNGTIHGIGPRYCPSIEDKVMRFPDKTRHQIFVEPEGRDSDLMYIQGMSSSLPKDVQEEMYHSIKGLTHARFIRYAYAIEYDCINPLELSSSLQVKRIKGLYSAGQINGSSGYEEAAAQGLMAGINAALYVDEKPPFTLNRDEAYIGVLIDDLVTKGTNEPYRMMTARAEYRLRLRQDNADLRLTEKGYALGLATEERLKKMQERRDEIERIVRLSETVKIKKENGGIFERYEGVQVEKTMPVKEALKHPGITFDVLKEVTNAFSEFSKSALFSAEVMIKYAGYLEKEDAAIRDARRLEEKILPEDIDYNALSGLRIEARQKLSKIRPATLGQASRISGVSPADITVLLIYLKTAK